jgi:hypothetical protein
MSKKIKRSITMLLIVTIPCILMSCGSNVFEGLATKPNQTEAEELNKAIKTASTVEEFKEAKIMAEELVESDPTNPDGHIGLGKAILGESEVTVVDIGPKIMNLLSTDSSSEESASSSYTVIEDALKNDDGTERISSSNLRKSADSFNTANDLEEISSQNQQARGIANALAATTIMTNVFEVSDDGVEKKNENNSTKECLKEIANPDGNDSTNDGFPNYANNADSGFEKSGTYGENEDSQKSMKKITEKGNKVDNLYKAAYGVEGATPFAYKDNNGVDKTINSTSTDEELDTALDWIFKKES